MQVGSKRWHVDLQSRQEAQLLLSAVTLPGGVQRRRTAEDELSMREVFQEGDLISVRPDSLLLYSTPRSTQ
jgi:exosome complex component RRP4